MSSEDRPGTVKWSPGWQTAAEMQADWYDNNSGLTPPSPETRAEWRAYAEAEREYYRTHPADTADNASTASLPGQVRRDPPTTAEPVTSIGSVLPARVVVPAHPMPDSDGGGPRVDLELARLDAGLALVAYTTVAKLTSQLGPFQPWIELPREALARLHNTLPVLLDPVDGVVEAVWTAERLRALQEASGE